MSDNTTLTTGVGGDAIRDIDRSGVKTQVVTLDFGGQAGPESLTTQTNPLPTGIAASYFTQSTNNSTTAQLASGAIFTGVIETVFNHAVVSLLLVSDRNMILTLNQYIDLPGVKVLPALVFATTANVPFSRSFTLNGNYCNITLQNIGGATTTTLQLNTAYGEELPVTALGNQPVAINEVGGVAVVGGQVPTYDASNAVTAMAVQASDKSILAAKLAHLQLQAVMNAHSGAGFVPIEVPTFLGGY